MNNFLEANHFSITDFLLLNKEVYNSGEKYIWNLLNSHINLFLQEMSRKYISWMEVKENQFLTYNH